MKIYEIEHEDGEKEWVSGESYLDAVNTYLSTTECDIWDIKDSEMREVPEYTWRKYRVKMEGGKEISFKCWMRYNPMSKEIICGTMYEV